MKKIPTIFVRDPNNRALVLNRPHPDCEWVFAGEGVATRKYDGTCVLIQDGKFYKRREVKSGHDAPYGFLEVDRDAVTGKRFGWVEVEPTDPSNKWHMEAFEQWYEDGTYELIGPKIQGNHEQRTAHLLVSHDRAMRYPELDHFRGFAILRDWLKVHDVEGIVFHHPDGRMGKIKKRDFGFKR